VLLLKLSSYGGAFPKSKLELIKNKLQRIATVAAAGLRSAFSGFSWDDDVNAKAEKNQVTLLF
jgi:hypothetical protein